MTPRFQIISDLHAEISDVSISSLINDTADVVILGGDISFMNDSINQAHSAARSFPEIEFILILGNHELYQAKYDYNHLITALPKYNLLSKNLHVLENSSIWLEQYDLEIYGGIGWSNLRNVSTLDARILETQINDYSYITVNDMPLTVPIMRELNQVFRASCLACIRESVAKHKIVVSHFPQSLQLRHSGYPNGKLERYFCSDDDELVAELGSLGVMAMVSGHTHESYDIAIRGVRQVSNQIGYPFERANRFSNVKQLYSLLD